MKATRNSKTLALMKRGWITALESATAGGVLSLSQRVGNWRKDGMRILDKWIVTPSGARVKAYRLGR